MTIEEFIGELAKWDPINAFKNLKIPVRREKNEIKNPEVMGIVNIYSNESVVFEKKEGIKVECEKEDKKEYVEYNAKKYIIEDNNWINNSEQRCKNLQVYLESMKDYFEKYSNSEIKKEPIRLFVGEAPGRLGCFLTGIPFTDINTLNTLDNPFIKDMKSQLDVDAATQLFTNCVKEDTSSIVWECLNQLHKKSIPSPLPLLWNIYPFYPWKYGVSGKNRINRTPENEECDAGVEFLKYLLDCFPCIKHIHAIGRKSEEALERKLYFYMRHPANGGASEFKRQFSELYELNQTNQQNKN